MEKPVHLQETADIQYLTLPSVHLADPDQILVLQPEEINVKILFDPLCVDGLGNGDNIALAKGLSGNR